MHQAQPRLLARIKLVLCRLGLSDFFGLTEFCECCGKTVQNYWWAHPALWQEVVGEYEHVRCLACFEAECVARGLLIRWLPSVVLRRDAQGQWNDVAPPDPEFHPVAARLHAEARQQ
jgi:hypothetical protein